VTVLICLAIVSTTAER